MYRRILDEVINKRNGKPSAISEGKKERGISMKENTYWNRNGTYQKELREMIDAELNKHYTKKSKATAYRYYRFYNDGDIPRGMSKLSMSFISVLLEAQADTMIVSEYDRFMKAKKEA